MKVVYHQFEPVIVRWIVAAIVVALVLLIASVAAACPTCKEGLAQNDPQGQSIAAGYYYSILFMMSMPYIDPRHVRQPRLPLDPPRPRSWQNATAGGQAETCEPVAGAVEPHVRIDSAV